MSEVWGSVYAMERDRATGNDPESLRKRIRDLERDHDDYVVRANANVCELNQEIDRLRAIELAAKAVVEDYPVAAGTKSCF